MKIIGKTERGYIAEIDEHEIANITGFSSTYDREYPAHLKEIGALDSAGRLAVGAVIPVGKFWERLSSIRQNSIKLGDLGRTMRGLADLVDGAWPAAIVEIRNATGEG